MKNVVAVMKMFTIAFGIVIGAIAVTIAGIALLPFALELLAFALKVVAAMAVLGVVSGGVEWLYTKMLAKGSKVVMSWKDIDGEAFKI